MPRVKIRDRRAILQKGSTANWASGPVQEPVSKGVKPDMNRLLQFVSETFGRIGRSKPDVMTAQPTSDGDPWGSYVSVLEEARRRRGGSSRRS